MSVITITGPGEVINFEYYLVLKALKDAGIEVAEVNECAYQTSAEVEQHLLTIGGRIASGDIKNWSVRLEAKHLPWGG
jgi:hypothetical protein